MDFRIKLKKSQSVFYNRKHVDSFIKDLGRFGFNEKFEGLIDWCPTTDTKSGRLYDVQKFRSKKSRNSEGNYVIIERTKWIVTITLFPVELIKFIPDGYKLKQRSSGWKIEKL